MWITKFFWFSKLYMDVSVVCCMGYKMQILNTEYGIRIHVCWFTLPVHVRFIYLMNEFSTENIYAMHSPHNIQYANIIWCNHGENVVVSFFVHRNQIHVDHTPYPISNVVAMHIQYSGYSFKPISSVNK